MSRIKYLLTTSLSLRQVDPKRMHISIQTTHENVQREEEIFTYAFLLILEKAYENGVRKR